MYSWVPGVHRPILKKICSYEISFTTGKYISIKNCYHKKTLLSLQLAKLLLRLPLRWKEGYIDSHTKHCFLSLHLHIPGRLNTWIWESLFSLFFCSIVSDSLCEFHVPEHHLSSVFQFKSYHVQVVFPESLSRKFSLSVLITAFIS